MPALRHRANTALETAIERAGGIVKFSQARGVTHQAVSIWRKKGYVPFERAVEIEAEYDVPLESLIKPSLAAAYTKSLNREDVL